MMGLCEDVRRLVDSCEYTYVYVACDDFADAICATRELIDSGTAEHGGSGASENIYNGELFDGEEWKCLQIDQGHYLEYHRKKPGDENGSNVIYYRDYDLCDSEMPPPDIGAFFGI